MTAMHPNSLLAMLYQFLLLLLHSYLLTPIFLLLRTLQVMAAMNPDSLRAMLCKLFPHPCRSRYTAITMMPRPPGLIGQLAFKWVTASSTTKAAVALAVAAVVVAAVAAVAVGLTRRRAVQ